MKLEPFLLRLLDFKEEEEEEEEEEEDGDEELGEDKRWFLSTLMVG